MIEHNSDDKVRDSIAVIQSQNACQEAIDWWAKRKAYTLLELAKEYLAATNTPASWAAWYLEVIGNKADLEIRKCMIVKITDPMQAFSIYLGCDFLTDEEDRLLEEKFIGKLPRAEQELRDGVVRRKKMVAHG